MFAEINMFGEVIKPKEEKKVLKEEGVKKEPKPVIVEEVTEEETQQAITEIIEDFPPKKSRKSKK